MKKSLLALGVLSALTLSTNVTAANLEVPGGQTWHFTNWETRVSAAGDQLQGLIRLDQIFDKNGNTLFASGPGEEIVGYFNNLILSAPYTEALGAAFSFTGGDIFLYSDTTPNFNPTLNATLGSAGYANESPGATSYAADPAALFSAPILGGAGAGVTDGTLFAHLKFDTGISVTDPTATLAGSIRNLISADDGLGSPALQGDGAAFLSIVAGSSFNLYNTNGFTDLSGNKHDMRLDNTLFVTNGPAAIGPVTFDNTTNGWDTHSDDPVKLLATVPEPSSLALLGLALASFGFANKRRAA